MKTQLNETGQHPAFLLYYGDCDEKGYFWGFCSFAKVQKLTMADATKGYRRFSSTKLLQRQNHKNTEKRTATKHRFLSNVRTVERIW